jgi:hypothetical protein
MNSSNAGPSFVISLLRQPLARIVTISLVGFCRRRRHHIEGFLVVRGKAFRSSSGLIAASVEMKTSIVAMLGGSSGTLLAIRQHAGYDRDFKTNGDSLPVVSVVMIASRPALQSSSARESDQRGDAFRWVHLNGSPMDSCEGDDDIRGGDALFPRKNSEVSSAPRSVGVTALARRWLQLIAEPGRRGFFWVQEAARLSQVCV